MPGFDPHGVSDLATAWAFGSGMYCRLFPSACFEGIFEGGADATPFVDGLLIGADNGADE